MRLERLRQTYRRLGETSWRYSSCNFSADLEIDRHGHVLRYGTEWSAITYVPAPA